MQGLITLDFGNTNPHAGFFTKGNGVWTLTKLCPLEDLSDSLSELGMTPHNSSVVVCEVRSRENVLQDLQEQGFLLTRVKDYWRGGRFSGMPVHYAKTLGEDRLIEAFYAYKKSKEPTLLIDAGTFVTMDVITEAGFIGGYIIPGIKTYFECFQKGELLKGVQLFEEQSNSLPQETDKAMAGSYYAFAALAQQLITQHNIKNILLTGGQTALWLHFFKQTTQETVVESNPHLIHLALHYWMTTQIEPL
jgi:type III pantothenate kinase